MGRVKSERRFAAVENVKCHSQATTNSTNYDLLQTEKREKINETKEEAFLNADIQSDGYLDSV